MAAYVLDSIAVIAYLLKEKQGLKVKSILENARATGDRPCLSMINLGEIYYIVGRRYGMDMAEETVVVIDQLPIEIVEADRDAVLLAAKIKARYPISYADCFTVGLGIMKSAKIVTADPDFKRVEKLVQVEWL